MIAPFSYEKIKEKWSSGKGGDDPHGDLSLRDQCAPCQIGQQQQQSSGKNTPGKETSETAAAGEADNVGDRKPHKTDHAAAADSGGGQQSDNTKHCDLDLLQRNPCLLSPSPPGDGADVGDWAEGRPSPD